jgi:hypothetical protein
VQEQIAPEQACYSDSNQKVHIPIKEKKLNGRSEMTSAQQKSQENLLEKTNIL